MQPARSRAFLRTLLVGAAVTVTYVAAAEFGFRVAFVAEQVTTVWAPTGIAIATLLLGGQRLWPAIWLGAFLVNVSADAPRWTALVMATGNTLEAVVATWALARATGFDLGFRRVADVLSFIGVAVVAATTVSATIGVATLCGAGVQPWDRFGALWFDWWLGDALGALVVAPAILLAARCRSWSAREWATVSAFVGGAGLVTHLVFGPLPGPGPRAFEYTVFPVVMAAAVAGGPPATSLVVLGASAIAIWDTVRGAGPAATPDVHRSLVLLQLYVGVLAATALLLAAAIAERKSAERREREAAAILRRRDEMLSLAQRAGGVALFEWDFERDSAHCSAEFFRILGLPPRDGVMSSADWGRFVHPKDRDRMAAHLARALDRVEPALADYRIVLPDGTIRWLSYAGQLQNTPDGTRLLGTVLDITDRKRAEAALQDAKIAAESANQLKDQFLATLSHELRTPLNAILGYARMLQTEVIEPERRQRALEVIERNANAQKQLIEDLLDMSRIARGEVRLAPEAVSVVSVLNEAIDAFRPAAEAKRLALDVDTDPSAGMVTADRTRLQQVFWNVLSNAVKFTEPGGRILVAARPADGAVDVAITDTGAGISADFLPLLFEPFRQADVRLARSHGGLGLGLAISKQLVELHGGTIRAFSDGVGAGATFVIRLPRRPDGDAGAISGAAGAGDRAAS